MVGIRNQALALAGAMLMASTSMAQTAPVQEPVRVAVMDLNADQIDFKDANVRFVSLTPRPPQGSTFARSEAGLEQHGVMVASAFVEEYRRIDQARAITIYTVNPFIRRDGETSIRFRMQSLKDAIPAMKAAGVRIVVSAFSVSDKEAGDRIAKEFSDNGLILFAASPNQPQEDSIYPAASPGVIAIGEPKRGGPIESDPKYKKFVDFLISGEQGKGNGHVSGTSFASGKAAAYAAHLVSIRPETTIEDVKLSFRENGQKQPISFKTMIRLGDARMVQQYRIMTPASESAMAAVRVVTRSPSTESTMEMASLNKDVGPGR